MTTRRPWDAYFTPASAVERQGQLFCVVCASPDVTVTAKALNGLPRDVAVCDDCKDAVKRRQVGISRFKDGTLSVTDGRKGAAAA